MSKRENILVVLSVLLGLVLIGGGTWGFLEYRNVQSGVSECKDELQECRSISADIGSEQDDNQGGEQDRVNDNDEDSKAYTLSFRGKSISIPNSWETKIDIEVEDFTEEEKKGVY